ncbi:transposase [Amaricoccus macauensis]|uniref:transposase n=1 Tax=Amaricoccus macauensis TaxID=57001 RepID=UPI0016212A85
MANAAYDSKALRGTLLERGTTPVIPNNPTRKRPHPFDRGAYRQRNAIERTVCRLTNWRRVATRYDRLATNFLTAVTIAATVRLPVVSPNPGITLARVTLHVTLREH